MSEDQDRANRFLERMAQTRSRKPSRQEQVRAASRAQRQEYQWRYQPPPLNYHNRIPTKLQRLRTVAYHEWVRRQNAAEAQAGRPANLSYQPGVLYEDTGDLEVHPKVRDKLRGDRSLGAERYRQVRGIPAPAKKPKTKS